MMVIRKKLFNASLRHKVILEQKSQTTDGAGGYATVWETVATLWASIERVRGNESYKNGQLTTPATHIFRLRYNSVITPDMRFSFNNRLFNIRTINNPAERNHLLEVYAEEGVAVS